MAQTQQNKSMFVNVNVDVGVNVNIDVRTKHNHKAQPLSTTLEHKAKQSVIDQSRKIYIINDPFNEFR